MAYLLWKNADCVTQFNEDFQKGVEKILEVFHTEQYHEEKSSYRFNRNNGYYRDTLSRDGKGALVKSGTGLIWSGFRPSDDACTYGYLIPSNMFAVVVLGYLEEIETEIYHNQELAKAAKELKDEVYQAIETIGKTFTEEFGMVYAYETDGFGMYNLMDDANVPIFFPWIIWDILLIGKLQEIQEDCSLAKLIHSISREKRQQELEALIHLPTMFGILLWQFRDLQKLNRKRKWKF